MRLIIRKKLTDIFLLLCILLCIRSLVYGQEIENRFQARTSISFSKKITKTIKFELAPELRWIEDLELDRYQLNSKIVFKPLDFLSLAACYRFIGNKRPEQETEYLNRYQFSAIFKTKIERWEPGLRISYTNYTDDSEGKEFLRYKTLLSYDIKKCKITPETGFEVFHQLDLNNIYKCRFKLGVDYKLSKKLTLGACYKLDYYMTKYKNRHIVDLDLKVTF